MQRIIDACNEWINEHLSGMGITNPVEFLDYYYEQNKCSFLKREDALPLCVAIFNLRLGTKAFNSYLEPEEPEKTLDVEGFQWLPHPNNPNHWEVCYSHTGVYLGSYSFRDNAAHTMSVAYTLPGYNTRYVEFRCPDNKPETQKHYAKIAKTLVETSATL